MMIQKNKSVMSSQECVGSDTKMMPTIVRSKDRQKIQTDNGSKIQVMWTQKEDNRRIPKKDTQGRTKKVR